MPLVTTSAILRSKLRAVEHKAVVDFGLWAALVPENVDDECALRDIAEAGAVGLKAFLSRSSEVPCVDDSQLARGMRQAALLGLPVAVHCESQAQIDLATDALLRDGRRVFLSPT